MGTRLRPEGRRAAAGTAEGRPEAVAPAEVEAPAGADSCSYRRSLFAPGDTKREADLRSPDLHARPPRAGYAARVLSARVAAVAVVAALIALPSAADARVKVLKRFTSCDGMVSYGEKYAAQVARGVNVGATEGIPVPTTAPVPPAAAPDSTGSGATDDSSTTNNQEAGVDEPDIVKTDGKTLFALVGDELRAYDVRAATPKLLGSVAVSGGGELLISGTRALVIGTGDASPLPLERLSPSVFSYRPTTRLSEVDISDPSAMTLVRTVDADGSLVDARLTGSTARVVIQTHSWAIQQGTAELRKRVVGWLPQATITNRRTKKVKHRALTPCDTVRRPRVFAGLDMVTVLTIDVAKGLPAIDSDAVMADADQVYASPTSLYVTTHTWSPPQTSDDQEPPRERTGVHLFDISKPDETTYRASGEVDGYTLNQYSMSEYKGVLRIATTNRPSWWSATAQTESESFVTTLRPELDKLVRGRPRRRARARASASTRCASSTTSATS